MFVINGGTPLAGDVTIKGAKNAILPLLAASMLTREECVFEEVPLLEDVFVLCEVLRYFGVRVVQEGSTLVVQASDVDRVAPPEHLMKKMRASNLILGPVLSRNGEVHLPFPGGCAIGSRPMNYHLLALSKLGVELEDKGAYIEARTSQLTGGEICLDFPSVGATENAMMAAVRAKGFTIIRNAAREPEVVDLARFLNQMGGRVRGAGTGIITIEGVSRLHGVRYTVIKDRIETGTFMLAAAISGGDVLLRDVDGQDVAALTAKMQAVGAEVRRDSGGLRVACPQRVRGVDVRTMPYPGFPTDLQPQFMALMATAEGSSIISETIFENRFRHVAEMHRMGADIKVVGDAAVVTGRERLWGAAVEATDLRAGAALVLLGLAAEGQTLIENIHYIDRGYESLEKRLQALGADIRRDQWAEERAATVCWEFCPTV